jgi:predicted AlkP superfamily phosphohydrolase/phosphomutase
VIRDYYRYLDEEIGSILELLDDETVVAVVSDHGAQRLDGGFCVNEWLIRQGLLVLNEYPSEVTPFDRLSIDWSKTTAWSEGGYYARVFLNVKGREPQGVVDQADYEQVRDDLTARLEATEDDLGRPLGTVVFKPDRLYRTVRNIAPDLIVHFGGLYWRSIGGVGYGAIHVEENDTGPDDCNHAQFGSIIVAAPKPASVGEIQGMHLLDVAPTLLELAGYDVPSSMQGRSLSSLPEPVSSIDAPNRSDEETVHRRLSGLGYI